jgi:NADH-quinone oxidoreductase subunit K
MALELIIFSVIVNLITYSSYLDDSQGQTFSLFLLTIAAAESALGLAISVIYYKLRGTLKNIFVSTLKT